MTDEDWIELGRRVVACKHWRWMPGMAWVIPPEARGAWPARLQHGRYPIPKCLVPVPDLRDPATLGCLLALVREARPDCVIWVARDCVVDPLDDTEHMLDEREGWTVCGGTGEDFLAPYGSGPTEAAALVAALEAADD